jgi:uroporphyrin-III C-methyltransferase/precorrin-2 dehydrogenase/sirohydrochlorin ferrochelatase
VNAPAPIAIVPVGLRVDGRSVLVVGAGRIAARKARAYVDQGAAVTVVAPEHSPEMAEVAVARRVVREFRPRDVRRRWLVVTATGDRAVDAAVFRAAERRRIWCNAADDPANCSVILPAVARDQQRRSEPGRRIVAAPSDRGAARRRDARGRSDLRSSA